MPLTGHLHALSQEAGRVIRGPRRSRRMKMWVGVCGVTVRLFMTTTGTLLVRTAVHWCTLPGQWMPVSAGSNASHPGVDKLPNYVFPFDLHFLDISPILFWATLFCWLHFSTIRNACLISYTLWQLRVQKLRNNLHVIRWSPFLEPTSALKPLFII